MPKIIKKKVAKVKKKTISKPKIKEAKKLKEKIKNPIKISKVYEPKENEKYMCEKHKVLTLTKTLR